MKVSKYDYVSGAQKAEGIVVVIDVFRAFSVACFAFHNGLERLFPMADSDDALAFKRGEPNVLRVGEREGKRLPGFDFGNSPTEIEPVQLDGKVLVQTTHAGTQGLVNAHRATEVLTGALVNAQATAAYIKQKNPQEVSLVRMGWAASEPTDEDNLCADYLESLLLNTPFDDSQIKETLRASPCAERFLDPDMPWSPLSDFERCTDANRFHFVLRLVSKKGERPFLERVNLDS
jgi:2-phosphosulfolactate phosphatase